MERIVATATANGWHRKALRREQFADNDLGPLIREMELGNAQSGRTSVTAASLQELLA